MQRLRANLVIGRSHRPSFRLAVTASSLVALVACSRAAAAEATHPPAPPWTTFDYGIAVAMAEVRDDTLRPLRWTGVVPSLALGFDTRNARLWHSADVGLGVGFLWNRYGHEGALFTQSLHYSLTVTVHRGEGIELSLGGAYRYESLDAYYYDWDDSFMYWFTTHSVAPAVRFAGRASRRTTLWATVEWPVLGLMSRQQPTRVYKMDPLPYVARWPALVNRHPVWVGPTNVLAPTLLFRADYALGRHFGLRGGLDVAYRRALEPSGYYALVTRLSLELRHAF